MDFIDEIKQGARWEGRDAFPSSELWRLEVNKWGGFIKESGQFARFLPRLKDTPKKRDETLAEISAAYFVSKIRSFPILKWEPEGENNQKGEFTFRAPDGTTVFCEVKSPGWEAEVAKQDKHSPRLSKPKFIHAEAKFFNSAPDIRHCVEKAYLKFKQGICNLLIIVDDLLFSLNLNHWGVEEALFYERLPSPYSDMKAEGCFVADTFCRMSALATLNVQLTHKIEYHWRVYSNTSALIRISDILNSEKLVYDAV